VANVPTTAGQPGGYFLRSRRLGFRHWRATDLALAASLWSDPIVTRFIGGALSLKEVASRLQIELASQQEHGMSYWPLFALTDGEHVGCSGLRPRDLSQRVAEAGVHIRPAFWRRGYASEALAAVIAVAFGELGLSGLFAGHHPENRASQGLLQKLGFARLGEELYQPTGLMHPSYFLRASHPGRANTVTGGSAC
jgi:RimJ/RimL family protein N-acetyltransferase